MFTYTVLHYDMGWLKMADGGENVETEIGRAINSLKKFVVAPFYIHPYINDSLIAKFK